MIEYIKREDAFDVACAECEAGTFYDIPSKIMGIPSADVVERKHGEWRDAMQSCHDSPHVKCSVCGEYYWRYFKKFNFCPNCGARMEDNSNGQKV